MPIWAEGRRTIWPALKRWKESSGSTAALGLEDSAALPRIPIQIADLAHELWQRANATRTEELKSLRGQDHGDALGSA
jgi:hypothetical protein